MSRNKGYITHQLRYGEGEEGEGKWGEAMSYCHFEISFRSDDDIARVSLCLSVSFRLTELNLQDIPGIIIIIINL